MNIYLKKKIIQFNEHLFKKKLFNLMNIYLKKNYSI